MTCLVLLTGGTRFVGRHLLNGLLSKNIKASLVKRSHFESDKRITGIRTRNLFKKPKEIWQEVYSDHGNVIHTTWYVEQDTNLYSPLNFECLSGALRLAKSAINWPIATGFQLHPTLTYGLLKTLAFLMLKNIIPDEKFAWPKVFYLFGEGDLSR